MAKPRVVIVGGQQNGRGFDLSDRVRIGRDPTNDICIPDPTVSSFHGEIRKADTFYEIVDLGSKNRLRVNGRKIFKPTALAHGDTIEVGQSRLRFEWPDGISQDMTETAHVNHPHGKQKEELEIHTQKISENELKSHFQSQLAPGMPVAAEPSVGGESASVHKRLWTKPPSVRIYILILCTVLLLGAAVYSVYNWPNGNGESPPPPPPSDTWKEDFQNDLVREGLIRELWVDWEKRIRLNGQDQTPDMMYIKAKRLADNLERELQSGFFLNAPSTYEACLKARSYAPSESDLYIICCTLIDSLQKQIEKTELDSFARLDIAMQNEKWDAASAEVKNVQDLLALRGENSKSRLALLYWNCENFINQLRGRQHR